MMARNTLENALRWQEHLGNQTTCHSCAVSQALNVKDQKEKQMWQCECGELYLEDKDIPIMFCQKCGREMTMVSYCTRNQK